MSKDAMEVIFDLAREALAQRDGYASRGWIMPELPLEDEVRELLGEEPNGGNDEDYTPDGEYRYVGSRAPRWVMAEVPVVGGVAVLPDGTRYEGLTSDVLRYPRLAD